MNTSINTSVNTSVNNFYKKYKVDSKFDNSMGILEPFQSLLKPFLNNGWQIVTCDLQTKSTNTITINKKYDELNVIKIEYIDYFYHFSLPIQNSKFNYYTKIKCCQPAFDFFENYIDAFLA